LVQVKINPGMTASAVISHALWQRRYAGDASVTGRQVLIGGRSHTIVGIMPPSFRFPTTVPLADVWMAGSTRGDIEERGSRNYWTVAASSPESVFRRPEPKWQRSVARLRPNIRGPTKMSRSRLHLSAGPDFPGESGRHY
jgi:hypothetical protein